MITLQIDVLNPKATRLLEDLAALELIAIRQTGSNSFQRVVDKLRANADDVPSPDEITADVEVVRVRQLKQR